MRLMQLELTHLNFNPPCNCKWISLISVCFLLASPTTTTTTCENRRYLQGSCAVCRGMAGAIEVLTWLSSVKGNKHDQQIHTSACHIHSFYVFPCIDIASTYDHRVWKTGLPVRSAVLKPHAGRLVVGWVTTSESRLLYVFVLGLARLASIY